MVHILQTTYSCQGEAQGPPKEESPTLSEIKTSLRINGERVLLLGRRDN